MTHEPGGGGVIPMTHEPERSSLEDDRNAQYPIAGFAGRGSCISGRQRGGRLFIAAGCRSVSLAGKDAAPIPLPDTHARRQRVAPRIRAQGHQLFARATDAADCAVAASPTDPGPARPAARLVSAGRAGDAHDRLAVAFEPPRRAGSDLWHPYSLDFWFRINVILATHQHNGVKP